MMMKKPSLQKKFSPSCSQKPKRRLFLDSSEGEDVEKEDKDKREEEEEAIVYRNRCLEQKLARARALHTLACRINAKKQMRSTAVTKTW